MEEAAQQAAHVLAQLAADKIQRLDAVGALVELRDARVAHQLLHAVLADVAVAAEDLHAQVGHVEAGVGEEGLDDRRHQRDQVVGLLALFLVGMLLGDIDGDGDPQRHSAGAFVQRPHGQQVPAHVRMHDDRVGRFVGMLRARATFIMVNIFAMPLCGSPTR